MVNQLIDEFIDAGEADLVRDFTFEFPTRVIAKLLGLPEEDLPWFRKRAVELISYTIKYKRAFEASAALKDYFLAQIDKRRASPTEDIIGDLVSAEIEGERLTDEAIFSFLRLLLPAGLETTYRSSGNLLYLLLTHRDQFDAVSADHELIGPAIEEALRYETPLTTVQRFATADTEVEGVRHSRRVGDRRLHRIGQSGRTPLGDTPRSSTSFGSGCRTSLLPRVSTPAWGCTWRGWKRVSPSSAY